MLETALIAFTTYFATIGPADVAALFAALTPDNTPAERRQMALKGTLIATVILLVFALFGEAVLRLFGISLPALRIAGGILPRLMRSTCSSPVGGTTTTSEENAEAVAKDDISVFPLATPLIAGRARSARPCSWSPTPRATRLRLAVVILVLLGMLLLTFLLLLVATQVHRLLGVTGLHGLCGSSACCSRRSPCSSSSTASARAASWRDPGGFDAAAAMAGLVWLAQTQQAAASGNRRIRHGHRCSSSKPRSRRSW